MAEKHMDDEKRTIETLRTEISLRLASSEALSELARSVRRIAYQKGDYVFEAGDDSDNFYMVEEGRVTLSKTAPSGKVFTYMIAVRGMTLNGVTSFRSGPRVFSARVAEKTTLLAIPSKVFREWVLENPDVAAAIYGVLARLLDGAYSRILDIIDESAEKRVLNSLAMLSARIGLELPLTNNDVAEMTGVTRETAARIISRLQEAGLLSKARGTIRILDIDQLKELSTSPFFLL
ncbi:MAG: Crp/Fnr family transcriptional regulator [Desulfovibrio sp.]|uniref:Crp/Fnr family transcriptional regulator n=1 Tax=Desulfovibrio sp. 7SRBS1 TaxID=3378064 RepID=UPI003B3F112E